MKRKDKTLELCCNCLKPWLKKGKIRPNLCKCKCHKKDK